jgi:hypothetical protein
MAGSLSHTGSGRPLSRSLIAAALERDVKRLVSAYEAGASLVQLADFYGC